MVHWVRETTLGAFIQRTLHALNHDDYDHFDSSSETTRVFDWCPLGRLAFSHIHENISRYRVHHEITDMVACVCVRSHASTPLFDLRCVKQVFVRNRQLPADIRHTHTHVTWPMGGEYIQS